MDKKTSLAIITQAARIYDSQLNNKNFLLIYGELRKPQHIELMFGAKNFHHLTGIVINKKHLFRDVHDKNSNELEVFYFKALNGKLHENDIGFKTDGTTEQKMRVLLQTLTISKSIKMYGDFVDNRVKLKTEKVAGGTNSFLGFVKSNGFYVPNTVIEGDIRNNVYTPYTVYGILSKSKDDTYYNQVITMKKNIDVDDLLTKVSNSVKIDKSIFLKMESTLQNSDIDKVHIVKFDNSINKPMNPVITDSAIPLALTPQNLFMDIINAVNSLGKKLQSVFAPEAKEHTSKFTAPKNYSKSSQPIPYTPKSKKTEAVKKNVEKVQAEKAQEPEQKKSRFCKADLKSEKYAPRSQKKDRSVNRNRNDLEH